MINHTFRTPVDSLEYFALLVADEYKLPLAEAATNIAQIQYPDLTLHQVADESDQLIQKFCPHIKDNTEPLYKISILNRLFFQELGFWGHGPKAQDDIELSCINQVLKNKYGSNTLITIIYLEIAKAIGLQARGVIFPNQMLIKVRLTHHNNQPAEVIINPASGRSLNTTDIRHLLTPFKTEHGLVDEYDIPSDLFLETATSKDILTHLLYQVRSVYMNNEAWDKFIKTLDRLIILQPSHIDNYRERGYAYIKCGNPHKAVDDLEHYLQHARTQFVSDVNTVENELNQLRKATF